MISLKEIFLLEAGEDGNASPPQKKKKPQQPQVQKDPAFLKQVQKGLNNQGPASQNDADFLKATQQGLNKVATRQPQPLQPQGKGIPSLSQLAKGAMKKPDPRDADPALKDLPKFDDQPEDNSDEFSDTPIMYKKPDDQKVQQDPDFLKAIQKGLNNLKPGNPVRDPEPQPIPTPMPQYEPNDKIPSLTQLAKGAEEPEDPALAGLPKFDQEPEQEPFGNPDFQMPNQQAPDGSQFQTLPQRTASAVKKTIGQAAAGAGNALRNFGKDRGAAPSPAMAKTNNPGGQDSMAGLPPNWKTDPEHDKEPEPATGTEPQPDDDMPTLRSLSKQRFGRDVFKDTSSKWRVGDIVRVGTQDGFKVQRKDPNGWVLTRKGQNYKFIPHGGLFKV